MNEIVSLLINIITDILTALYESFGFAFLLSFVVMFSTFMPTFHPKRVKVGKKQFLLGSERSGHHVSLENCSCWHLLPH